MDTSKIDRLNRIIDETEKKLKACKDLYDHDDMELVIERIQNTRKIIEDLNALKEITKEILYNVKELNYDYSEKKLNVPSDLRKQVQEIFCLYKNMNNDYYYNMNPNESLSICNIDFEVASNKLSTAIRKLEVIVEKE